MRLSWPICAYLLNFDALSFTFCNVSFSALKDFLAAQRAADFRVMTCRARSGYLLEPGNKSTVRLLPVSEIATVAIVVSIFASESLPYLLLRIFTGETGARLFSVVRTVSRQVHCTFSHDGRKHRQCGCSYE